MSLAIVKSSVAMGIFFCSGITITCYNKWFLSIHGFMHPVTMISFHMVTNFLFSCLFVFLSKRCHNEHTDCPDACILDFNFRGWSWYFKTITPIGLLTGADIALTTYSIGYSTVTLTEVIKSAIPLLLMLAGFLTGSQKPNLIKILTMCLLSIGISLTTFTEVSFNMKSFIASVLATLAGVSKLLLTERILHEKIETVSTPKHFRETAYEGRISLTANEPSSQDSDSQEDFNDDHSDDSIIPQLSEKLHPIIALLYFTPISAMALIPCTVVFEGNNLMEDPEVQRPQILYTIFLLLCGGILAFFLNISELFLIQGTSALSLCIMSVVKLLLLIPFTSWLFSREITIINTIGCGLDIIGVALYNIIKYRETSLARSETITQHALKYSEVIMHDFNKIYSPKDSNTQKPKNRSTYTPLSLFPVHEKKERSDTSN